MYVSKHYLFTTQTNTTKDLHEDRPFQRLNSLPNDKILDLSELKAIDDDNLIVNQK